MKIASSLIKISLSYSIKDQNFLNFPKIISDFDFNISFINQIKIFQILIIKHITSGYQTIKNEDKQNQIETTINNDIQFKI